MQLRDSTNYRNKCKKQPWSLSKEHILQQNMLRCHYLCFLIACIAKTPTSLWINIGGGGNMVLSAISLGNEKVVLLKDSSLTEGIIRIICIRATLITQYSTFFKSTCIKAVVNFHFIVSHHGCRVIVKIKTTTINISTLKIRAQLALLHI